jgi:transcriptional regulator with XRE-family HTH domain
LKALYKIFLVSDDIKHEVKKLHIGRKIRELRKKAGFVLQDLSDRTGLSKPLLSQIEKEVVSPPIATLLKISKALLYPGDSLYFESSIPHAYRALERKNARALTVVYPTR